MKQLFSLCILIALFSFTYADDIYNLAINTIDGKKVELRNYKGKKMLFVVLPLSEKDTSLSIDDLDALQRKYESTLVVIGIAAQEEGFKKGDEEKIKKLYKKMKPEFVLSEGVKVKKASGSEQSDLFQWLTNKNKNRHFDQEVKGVGTKFFVDEYGDLYAVMGPQTKLTHPVIDRILSKPIKK